MALTKDTLSHPLLVSDRHTPLLLFLPPQLLPFLLVLLVVPRVLPRATISFFLFVRLVVFEIFDCEKP